ncbi:manganese-dependent inorganic pyrophosphatase [Methanococcus maripaludis]|uniref:inorganic diphosphatase n=1 Tax=Methanococcus maripaludis TaxID=39152 RepID=A0A2L1CA56_METMI|nr:manganese-dependent inorganic pyrophosphatase [Methanococcus maripaludis]AVB76252.1 Manganese-dependent inorganic pyrophosphatase [Methanococcus maripaludis]MBA2864675.1 manganese-dependent inorganic pyrophosphatase [Methanococcus maripaludis]MBB6497525.1 manganese-dependent inorganic pyrophosphatase [Methanococcus maripaludis]
MMYVVGHKNPDSDSICSAIALAYFLDAFPARLGELNPESQFILKRFGLMEPELIKTAEGKELFLVDHAEKSQNLDDFDKGKLIGIIDHHKIGISTTEPIIYLSKPVGSTASVISELYFRGILDIIGGKNKELKADIAGVLLSAILSDTLLFKSPTATQLDKELAGKLAEIAEISDITAYGMEMLTAKSTVGKMTPEEILHIDYKPFDMGGKKVGIGQAEVIDMSEVASKKEAIQNLIDEMIEKEGYDMVLFLVTDIMREGSEVLVAGNKSAFETAFKLKLDGKSVFIDGLMSRKKQVVPPLEKYYSN